MFIGVRSTVPPFTFNSPYRFVNGKSRVSTAFSRFTCICAVFCTFLRKRRCGSTARVQDLSGNGAKEELFERGTSGSLRSATSGAARSKRRLTSRENPDVRAMLVGNVPSTAQSRRCSRSMAAAGSRKPLGGRVSGLPATGSSPAVCRRRACSSARSRAWWTTIWFRMSSSCARSGRKTPAAICTWSLETSR